MTLATLIAEPWQDYGLVDSGHGRKLERYGRFRFIRPEPQAMWAPASDNWRADGEFVPASDEDGGGRWHLDANVPDEGWPLGWEDVRFQAQCTPFRHLAFFPDMASHWGWMREFLSDSTYRSSAAPARSPSRPPNQGTLMGGREGERAGAAISREGNSDKPECLNLFGYTGVGSLALAAKGAKVTHVDASKKSVEAGKANALLSDMRDLPIRWLVDDAAKFAAREVRRGRRYDGIMLDPPKWGRGPKKELWQLEEGLPGLIADCAKLLDADSRFLVLTVYAVRMSALAIGELVSQSLDHLGGQFECGEMAVREEARGLTLPTAIFARWSR
ncbi:MAG: class I SAM-dependent methyltransferase [Pseudomonadota bacterium]